MVRTVNVLGVQVSAIGMTQALDEIDGWIAKRKCQYVCVTGVHGVMESRRDASLLQIHNSAGLVTPDGMPLVWLGRLLGFHNMERVYGPDLMLAVCARSASKGYKHYFYGGAEGVAQRLAERLRERFPGLTVVGSFTPPFHELTEGEDAHATQLINEANPDIVWVGLSTPKQERWMASHRGKLAAPVLVGVGAAFDFHAGTKKQAPRWMQRSGLEWLFRLAVEPRRLGRRYLVNNPLFVALVFLQLIGLRQPEDVHSPSDPTM